MWGKLETDRSNTHYFGDYGAVSNRVGNSSLRIWEFTDAQDLVDFERWRHILCTSGVPGSWGWMETIRGEEWKGPRMMSSTSSQGKGPDILLDDTSLCRYSSISSKKGSMEGLFAIMTVCMRGGMCPRGKPYLKL
jgi:hypothetical protein